MLRRCGIVLQLVAAGPRRSDPLRLRRQIACGCCSMGDAWVVDPTFGSLVLARPKERGVDKQSATFGQSRAAGPELAQDRLEFRSQRRGIGVWDPLLNSRNTKRSSSAG